MITLNYDQPLSRKEIGAMLGGDEQKGIALATKVNAILLFANPDGIYKDYFYSSDGEEDNNCMYTGIGTEGHQDSVDNPMYNLNMAVLTHKATNKSLLIFKKQEDKEYHFIGEYKLVETHQNVQIDKNNFPRRVFVFHLHRISKDFEQEAIK